MAYYVTFIYLNSHKYHNSSIPGPSWPWSYDSWIYN